MADRISNPGSVHWCAALSAAVVRDSRAVAGGAEDIYCADAGASWTEVVRVHGDPQPGDDVFVELMFTGRE